MPRTFEETYYEYQRMLLQLSESDDIGTKNALFRQLTELLCEMENLIAAKRYRRAYLGSSEPQN